MQKTIGEKINKLIIVSTLLLSVFIIGVNILIFNVYVSNNSEITMRQTCTAKAHEFNNQFRLVEQAVQNIYDISESIRPSAAELKDKQKVNDFIQSIHGMALDVAENTEGTICVYYRINPKLDESGEGREGFFWTKSSKTDAYEYNQPTDLLAYEEDDIEHVGWYYIPVRAKKAVWIDPYYNANIDTVMISYVIPVFDGDVLIGVVGMDVDFNLLMDLVGDVDIYESGRATLFCMGNNQIYNDKENIFGNEISQTLYNSLQEANYSDKLLPYKANGRSYKLDYETLNNRMKLVVYAKNTEIYKQRYISLVVSILIFMIVIILTLFFSMRVSKRITDPIEEITEVAKRYAEGDWNATISCNTDDELKVLTDNIMVMAEKTKEYINYIKQLARQDALTGLKNNTAYIQQVEKIKKEYIEQKREFAVVVFDVNNLKYINDNYGHEKGDLLLVEAGKYIQGTFVHSTIFRIGGDEFAAILGTEDYLFREELLDRFRKHMETPKNMDDLTDVCIACGMGIYPEDGEEYEDVFGVADQRMYQNKMELKESDMSDLTDALQKK